ncbi:uncharacterized protein K460DRAFT_392203 [Cucurbitaria berberidis CBS 394.84]|uniref:NAD(P)-binding domain-containing protein n=1 Tax=Cucurbitaria berberidis CBS 394.84 TaxID=1168544 RepID=A0A9P4GVD5_9PLEO|nr:uncharacterized protein K460DRAFT_392203 [Cucurbitaria berberidis CBS 394.84]KAF1852055.1 hypothetical protein K460DRAFT_392203 [Cucurbitaria berberidis CBS 394.84]
MKLIVAGATGFVGSEVLYAALQHPSVTSVVSLSRRPVLDPRVVNHAKWESILLEDFEHYPSDAIARMQGAVGCIWAIGGLANRFSNYETLHKANVVYPVTAARKFAETLASNLGPEHRFRFVYTSGALAERDQQKQLWTMRDSRLVKGEAELSLLDIANSKTDSFEMLIARPGFVLGKGDVKSYLLGFTGQTRTILVHDLASILVDMAVHGAEVIGGQDTADNLTLVNRAKELRESR